MPNSSSLIGALSDHGGDRVERANARLRIGFNPEA
jgi:hypothetical protein